ncbi:hypothetical protein ACRRTK_008265 [Alexandromys fortis]
MYKLHPTIGCSEGQYATVCWPTHLPTCICMLESDFLFSICDHSVPENFYASQAYKVYKTDTWVKHLLITTRNFILKQFIAVHIILPSMKDKSKFSY